MGLMYFVATLKTAVVFPAGELRELSVGFSGGRDSLFRMTLDCESRSRFLPNNLSATDSRFRFIVRGVATLMAPGVICLGNILSSPG